MQARLIVASNRPLKQEVAAGRFRADLFYRLNVIDFVMLPLRQRPACIPGMAEEFLAEFAAKTGRTIQGIAPDALKVLLAHSWPGNIRELRNVLERAVALSKEPIIGLDDLPSALNRLTAPTPPESVSVSMRRHVFTRAAVRSGSLAQSKAHVESGLISEVLERNGGNRLRAAAELGISRKTLYQKLSKYGLQGSA